MDKEIMVDQTKLAFSLIQKLYFETGLLIQEIEGMLGEEEEKFVIGKVAGYSISTRQSKGLERFNIPYWMVRKLAVFFIPEGFTNNEKGNTNTKITPNLKLIYIRIVLDDKDLKEPKIYAGVLHHISAKNSKKFEYSMASFDYRDFILKDGDVSLEDTNIQIKGTFFSTHLFDLSDSEDISSKIIKPLLKNYRSIL
jgi:hypothetical protein